MSLFKKKLKTYADTAALPPAYRQPSARSRLKNAEKQILFFLRKAHPDVYNGSFYDHLSDLEHEVVAADLARQQSDHQQSISLISERCLTDQILIAAKLDHLSYCIKDCREQLQKADALFTMHNTPKGGDLH